MNPVRHIVSDAKLRKLRALGLVDEYRLRNMIITKEFRRLRRNGMSVYEALLQMSGSEFCGFRLAFDTLRNIVYDKSREHESGPTTRRH